VRFESGQATGDSKATGNRNRDADPRWVLCVELRQASHMADARSIPSSCFQSNSRRGASQARLAAGEQRAALSRTHTRRGDVDGTRHPAAPLCALARNAAASVHDGTAHGGITLARDAAAPVKPHPPQQDRVSYVCTELGRRSQRLMRKPRP